MKINRFKRRLYSVVRDLEDLSEFIENNNMNWEDDETRYHETKRAMHEIDEMAAKVRNMESRADKMMFVEY